MGRRRDAAGSGDVPDRPEPGAKLGAADRPLNMRVTAGPVAAPFTLADELAATRDRDGWPAREARAILLVAAGGRTPDAAAVRGDRVAACDPVGTGGIAALSLLPTVRPVPDVGVVSEKSLRVRPCRVLRVPGGHKRAFGDRWGALRTGKAGRTPFMGGVQASKRKISFR